MGGGGGKGGGGGSTTIEVENSGTTTVDIVGLDDINVEQTLELKLPQPFVTEAVNEIKLPQPFKTESKTEFAITEPIRTDSTSRTELDIKPMVVDLCVNINMGKMPPTCIRQPYQHHFGFTMFGMEVFGFNFAGESKIIIEDHEPAPKVVWGGEQKVSHRPAPKPVHVKAESSGLRIRLND
jgi:hypothetical protein